MTIMTMTTTAIIMMITSTAATTILALNFDTKPAIYWVELVHNIDPST